MKSMQSKCASSLVLGAIFLLINARLCPALEIITVNFEGLSQEAEYPLVSQIPDVAFENVTVMTPATVRSSSGTALSAATSGKSAASSFGAVIRFSKPVIKVQMSVSPSFVSVPLAMTTAYRTVHLLAYDQTGKLLTSSSTPVIAAVPRPEDVRNFTPSTVSVSSAIPIAYVTVDDGEPWRGDGSRFLFDDLVLTIGERVPITSPTLRIDRGTKGEVYLFWDFFNCELQQTTNLTAGTWEVLPVPKSSTSTVIDPTKAKSMFFRLRRLQP